VDHPQNFFECIDAAKIQITRPRKFIFLCGGATAPPPAVAISAREQFLRSLPDRKKFEAHDIRLAEEVDAFYADSPYQDLIAFELDIAQVSDLIVLFSEGFGSLAELGAFSQIPPIAERLMVIIQALHYRKRSFIRDGPILKLEKEHKGSVEVFDWHGVASGSNPYLDVASFVRHLPDITQAICVRLTALPNWQTLDTDNFGHRIMVTAIVSDVFGAATFEDFKDAFKALGMATSDVDIRRMLFIASAVGWFHKEKRGHSFFYIPAFSNQPYQLAYKATAEHKDILRWKSDIRRFWQANDRQRSYLIADFPREGS
jgi:hypothetical protein